MDVRARKCRRECRTVEVREGCFEEIEVDVREDLDGNEVGWSPAGAVISVRVREEDDDPAEIYQKVKTMEIDSTDPASQIEELRSMVERLARRLAEQE